MRKCPEYTVKMHVHRLKMALDKYGCGFCPASKGFKENSSPYEMWSNNPCAVCVTFVGLHKDTFFCPCIILEDEVIQRTLRRIKDYEKNK